MFFRISQISQENTCVGILFSNVAGLKACNFVKKRLQHRCLPLKFAKYLRTPPVSAFEFCYGGCLRIVSVSKYIIISNQRIKVNVWWIAWCCIHSKIMPELDSQWKFWKYVRICTFVAAGFRPWFHSDMFWYFWIFYMISFLLNFTRNLFSENTIFLLMRNIRNECWILK